MPPRHRTHRTVLRAPALAVLAAAVLCGPPAAAEEGDVRAELDACRELVERRRWKAAREAYERLFEAHEGDRRLIAAREGIERDLQQCVFALQRSEPTGEDLFGPAVRDFSTTSRKIELVFEQGIADPTWEKIGENLGMLPLHFEPYVEIAVPATGRDTRLPDHESFDDQLAERIRVRAILSFDFGKSSGYLVTTPYGHQGMYREPDHPENPRVEEPGICRVFRIDGGEYELLKQGAPKSPRHRRREIPPRYRWFVISQRGSMIRIETEGKKPFEERDGAHQGGYVALSTLWRDPGRAEPISVRVSGTLDRDFVVQALAKHAAKEMERWKSESWDPAQVMPDWLLQGSATTMIAEIALPDDMPYDLRDEVLPLLRLIRFGEWSDEIHLPDTAGAPPQSRALVEGACALATGDRLGAEAWFTKLQDLAPEFPQARLWRARARWLRRDLAGALEDLANAKARLADDPAYHELLARIRLAQGELEGAREALAAARDAGVWTDELEALSRGVEAAVRGPQWKQPYRKQVGPFEVWSDHSMRVCQRVGQVLHDGVIRYAKTFRPVPQERRPARVYVFSSREAYDAYAEELGTSLSHSAGAYMPRLHVLVLWIPNNDRELEATVRHEGFHQYVHHFAEDLPLWFNEGWAEYFGNVARESRSLGHDTDRDGLAQAVARSRAEFVSLRELLRLSRREFMSDAAPRYVQAWAAVTFLRESDHVAGADALERYFAKLVEGRAPDEAYDAVFAAAERELADQFRAFLDDLTGR